MPIAALRTRLGAVKVGARVSYEDQANPLREATVVEVEELGRWYRIEWDDGNGTTSDLRQHGWNLIAAETDLKSR